jgi:hypothetical protein
MIHSIIPHHHHSEEIVAIGHDTCPVDNQNQDQQENFPFHCKAFNALSFLKATLPGIYKPFGITGLFDIPLWMHESLSKILPVVKLDFFIAEPIFSSFTGDLKLLRGPPCA